MENRETENAYFSEDECCYHYCHNHDNETCPSTKSSVSAEEENAWKNTSVCDASRTQQAAEERVVDVAIIGKLCVASALSFTRFF